MKTILMKTILFIFCAFSLSLSFGQLVEFDSIDANGATGYLNETGWLFSRPTDNSTIQVADFKPGYEYPSGSGKHILNGVGVWIQGENINGLSKISNVSAENFQEQFSGALSVASGFEYGQASPVGEWDDIYNKVTKDEIEFHIANFNDPNYQIPDGILNWPAHGDVTQGAYYFQAPFIDLNANYIYEPAYGDYPCIQGDVMSYMILNSNQHPFGLLNIGGIGVELRYSIFQYTSIPELEGVTFCRIEAINRSTETFVDFNAAVYLNGLIGAPEDDFVGTDVSRNMLYTYNGDNLDNSTMTHTGYGTSPPACGIKLLNHNIEHSKVFLSTIDSNHVFPNSREKFIHIMKRENYDGMPNPVQFEYDGDPVNGVGNIATQSESKIVGTFNLDTIVPGELFTIDFAVIPGQGTDNLNSIEMMRVNADYVQSFYNLQSNPCAYEFVNLPEIENDLEITIYPNPSSNWFNIEFSEVTSDLQISVFDISGREVIGSFPVNSEQLTLELNSKSGVYLLKIFDGKSLQTRRLVLR